MPPTTCQKVFTTDLRDRSSRCLLNLRILKLANPIWSLGCAGKMCLIHGDLPRINWTYRIAANMLAPHSTFHSLKGHVSIFGQVGALGHVGEIVMI